MKEIITAIFPGNESEKKPKVLQWAPLILQQGYDHGELGTVVDRALEKKNNNQELLDSEEYLFFCYNLLIQTTAEEASEQGMLPGGDLGRRIMVRTQRLIENNALKALTELYPGKDS